LRIKNNFPDLPSGFYKTLAERIRAHGFTDIRFTKAVDYVIDNCTYPRPTAANFIQADKDFQDQIAKFYTGPDR